MNLLSQIDRRRPHMVATAVVLLATLLGCSGAKTTTRSPLPRLRLATTTSTRDSGLLEELLPLFESENRCRVDVIAVGTGAALKLGERGDVDVLVVHARDAELAFMQAGYGSRHEEFMFNDFVLLGPPDDPAGVRAQSPAAALEGIASGEHPFISRGDDSGTHKRELQLWKSLGLKPAWQKYFESGQGMGATLIMADEKLAYVLSDRGTYLKFRDKIELTPLGDNAKDVALRNPYAAIVVRRDEPRERQTDLADLFVDFLVADETQKLIAAYRVGGEALFHPTRINDVN